MWCTIVYLQQQRMERGLCRDVGRKRSSAYKKALLEAIDGMYDMSELFGEIIEDRGTQVTFSALGQNTPLHLKETFDPDQKIRREIVQKITPHLPNLEIRIGGSTSIDITRKGIDKGYGIKKIAEHLDLALSEIGFVGDALFPGGNDYPAKALGLYCVEVKNPSETEAHILSWVDKKNS